MPRESSPWEPLPHIIYGYAVHQVVPASRRDVRYSSRTRSSVVSQRSADERFQERDLVPLEVGDEVYAFERYVPRGKEVEGIWYRGYVVSSARRPAVNWPSHADPSSSAIGRDQRPSEDVQQVTLGIFPASHIFERDRVPDAEQRLAAIASRHSRSTNGSANGGANGGANGSIILDDLPPWAQSSPREEDADTDSATRKSARLPPPGLAPAPEQATSSRTALTVKTPSIRSRSSSPSPTESGGVKPAPPRPTLKSGDDTAAGAAQPLVDEIAAALREWHALLYTYLARREYRTFGVVRAHIEALHLARRQLLAQTFSAEETTRLRRECVLRLASGNIAQGLHVVVRHPTWGALATVNVDGERDARSWMSAVRMYALQVALAYLDAGADALGGPAQTSADTFSIGPAPTPSISSFPAPPIPKGSLLSGPGDSGSHARLSSGVPRAAPAKFFHVFLEVRAFVASLCAPGERAELFFSLYNRAESQFFTEDFCAVLTHNGVLARDPAARIRALFVDLAQSDAQDPIFLVVRIVRAGALKIGTSMSTGLPEAPGSGRRGSEIDDSRATQSASNISLNGGGRVVGDTSHLVRRPFGWAVLELSQLRDLAAERGDMSSTKEFSMPIFVPTHEEVFSMLHQDIIANNIKEFEKSPRADHVAVTIKVFHGDAKTIVRENSSLLQDATLTQRLGFPDVGFPGDVRNEVYVKLWSGDFSSINTANSRLSVMGITRGNVVPTSNNIEVTVELREPGGRAVEPPALYLGTGEPPVAQFRSMVLQKNSQPTYGELFKVRLPDKVGQPWHLFFTFRNRGAREGRNAGRAADSQDKPFAFAFLPLFPQNQTFLDDGGHTLVLYRADRLSAITPDLYRSATPVLSPGQRMDQIAMSADMQRNAPPLRDTLTVRTSLASTKLTQNGILFTLLNWRKVEDTGMLSTVLSKFVFVGETELVKFLRDIFDALFGILGSNQNAGGALDQLVFTGLVTMLGIIQDRRFRNYKPMLDVYIERHFDQPAATPRLIRSMNRLLQADPNAGSASALRAALKVWDYIFKFVARSVNPPNAHGGEGAMFHQVALEHLAAVNGMMAATAPAAIIGTQTIALQHFASILPQLAHIFRPMELVNIATEFVDALAAAKGKLVIWKLSVYLQLAKSFLFDDADARAALVEAIAMWIRPYFGVFDAYAQTQDADGSLDAARIAWLESSRLCITIIAVMLDKLQECLVDPDITANPRLLRKEQDNVELLLPLLPRLLAAYAEFQSPASAQAIARNRSLPLIAPAVPVAFPESYPFALVARLPPSHDENKRESSSLADGALFNAGLAETAVVILVIVMCCTKKHITDFLLDTLETEGNEKMTALLGQIFQVASSILHCDAFPRNWLNINILAHVALMRFMDPISDLLVANHVPDYQDGSSTFQVELWKAGLTVVLEVLSSDQLVIEDLSPQRSRTVWRLAGDVRGEGADMLLHLWNSLGMPKDVAAQYGAVASFGGHQVTLNSLVGHVVHLCLSHHDQLRINAVQILYSMIISEYHASEKFDEIEHEIVSKLDSLFMSHSKGDEMSRSFFIGQLRSMFELSRLDENLGGRINAFLDSVDSFLELLLSVRALPDGEEFADDRVIATLRLMNYLRRNGRDEMYIKYVHQLVNMHIHSQNYVEAALTLQLHSDLHEWDLETFVPAMEELGLPKQSHFHRKETLCLLILDYLGKGKAWEKAIDICKELAYQHQEVSFNYARLSEILKHHAALLEHIVNEQRYYPEYFRVSYFGNFPGAVRNKQIIYRGYEWEKLGAFCERMLTKHSGAQLLKGGGEPPPDVRFGNEQYIQCVQVNPEPNRELPAFNNPNVPLQVKAYYEHNATNVFSISRPVIRRTRTGAEESWTEKTYFTTEASFPTVLRRSEVVSSQVAFISPIDAALAELEQQTRDLAGMYMRFSASAQTGQGASANAFSSALNNAVDAPENSGIALYRRTFLTAEYVQEHPDREGQVEALRKVVDEHVMTLDACLRLHGQLCAEEMLPFQETLEQFFRKNFAPELRVLGVDGILESEYAHSISPSSVSTSGVSPVSPPSIFDGQPSAPAFLLPPIQLGRSAPPRADSIRSPRLSIQESIPDAGPSTPRPNPLKRQLQHLARHGFSGGVTSGPVSPVSETIRSPDSPASGSFINVMAPPGLSATPSISGKSSMKSRLSRLGSMRLGR